MSVKLLDCTLRDGGYINDWKFGRSAISEITKVITDSGFDIFEIGFLKNEDYNPDRTVFNRVSQITPFLRDKKPGVKYAAMVEVVNPLPLKYIADYDGSSIDIIRVIIWKTKRDDAGNITDALKEGFEYCKGITEKGYKLCVQPARVDQYSDKEFTDMCKMFNTLNPLAMYIVDSWGTQNAESILHYAGLADSSLSENIALGYHGHNNLMQAYGNAVQFIQSEINRTLYVDASIYGIGRGAGNLNLEIIAKYFNDMLNTDYKIEPLIWIYEKYLRNIFEKQPWGYSIPYYLTALYNCNPNYAAYYKDLSAEKINAILKKLTPDERIMFNAEKADALRKEIEYVRK